MSRPLATSRQLCQQGLAAAERTHWDEAEKLFAKAVESSPADPDSRRHYAEALWLRGNREEAVAQLLEAGELSPEDASLRVRAAEMLLELGHWELALQSAQVALDLDPKSAGAWAVRGRVRQARGMAREALADFQRSLQYEPSNRGILLELAELYLRTIQPERALVSLQTLADTYPPGEEPQQVLLMEGEVCLSLGRYDDAVAKFATAAVRDKPTAEILWRLGEAEFLAGRPARAVAAAQEALSLDSTHQPSRQLLGRIEMASRPGAQDRR